MQLDFSDDESETEEYEVTHPDAEERIRLIQLIKTKIEEQWANTDIHWNNNAPERAFDENAPLRGCEILCGEKNSLVLKSVHVKELGNYLLNFETMTLNNAVGMAGDLVKFWKEWKSPAKRMDLAVKTWGLELTGTTPQWKPLMLFLAVLISFKSSGGTTATLPDASRYAEVGQVS